MMGEGLLNEGFHVRLSLVESETLEDVHAGFEGEGLGEEVD